MADDTPGGAGCQAPWLASVMWSAGALVDAVEPCGNDAGYRIVMRLSELGYAALFDVTVCAGHYEELRRSPYHVSSEIRRAADGPET